MRLFYFRKFVFVILLSCVAYDASANTGVISDDPTHAAKFTFYCDPYTHSFEADKHYIVNSSTCIYSIPSSISNNKIVGLYRGTPGFMATLVGGDLVTHGGTLITQTPNSFFEAQLEGRYFAVVYDASLDQTDQPVRDYLAGAIPSLPSTVEEGQNFYILPWVYGPKPPEEFDPVVIIPGILGSWERNGNWVLDPLTHIYDNLVNTLLANGYVENQTLFTFPYDWRKSNIFTANLLKNKILETKDVCKCSYVDIVAHSMGGLVTSQYVTSDGYEEDIDQIIFLGVPAAGAPKAYVTWESGRVDFGEKYINIIMQRIFEREARDFGFNTVFDYVRSTVSSIQELLPAYSYLTTGTQPLIYPVGYPRNTFLEHTFPIFTSRVFGQINLYVVIGSTDLSSTTSGFTIKPSTQLPYWEHGEILSERFEEGDGTVPHLSSLFLSGPEKEFLETNHTELASTSAGYVFETLTNAATTSLVGKIYGPRDVDYGLLIDKIAPSSGDVRVLTEAVRELAAEMSSAAGSVLEKVENVLLIALYSPIDVEVTSPDGKRIGKSISTNTVVNEIPNALYSGPNAEHEYVIIFNPLPGTYEVNIKGTGTGSYTVATGYANAATTSVSFVSGSTTLNQVTENTLTLSPATTAITIVKDVPPPPSPPPVEVLTPNTCVKDMQAAYKNGWIKKKSVLNALVADCKLLGSWIAIRDSAKNTSVRKSAAAAIKLTLDQMNTLAKDKGNSKEAVQLITKYIAWFKTH